MLLKRPSQPRPVGITDFIGNIVQVQFPLHEELFSLFHPFFQDIRKNRPSIMVLEAVLLYCEDIAGRLFT